jgi:peptide/nickel transport system permease protein
MPEQTTSPQRSPFIVRLWKSTTVLERVISVLMLLILITMVIGPWIAPKPTEKANPAWRLLSPRAEHWFGTDANGMDILSRVLASFRVDVAIALIATSISVVIGSAIGVLVAQLEGDGARGRLSKFLAEGIMRVLDVVQAFPVFIFAMVLVAIRGTNTTNIVAAIAFVNLPVFIRLVRSEVLTLQSRPYTEAAHAIGNSNLRIGFRHLLPNAVPAVIVQISVTVGFAILLTAGLSFVGAGVNPPTPELGAMIAGGARFLITGQWWPAVFPGIFLALTVFTFAMFGEMVGRLISGGMKNEADEEPSEPGESATVSSSASKVETQTYRHTATNKADQNLEELLRVDNLSVVFDGQRKGEGVSAVQDVSFTVGAGQRVGIVGETGSGKSVLVRAILGILPENAHMVSGDVTVAGTNLSSLDQAGMRKMRGTVLAAILPNPKAQLNPLIRVGKMMEVVLKAHDGKISADEIRARGRAALEQVGISDPDRRLQQFPHELSGGMAQRVCIALSLLHSPKLLVSDEPTVGLDVTVQRQVLDLLQELSNAQNASQLIVTRDFSIVAHYCNWVGVMHRGRLVEFGPTLAVFDDPQHEHTKELLKAAFADIHERSPRV